MTADRKTPKDEWLTPPEIFAALDREFHFTLDPCCRDETALCSTYITPEGMKSKIPGSLIRNPPKGDGLTMAWTGGASFVNPPYSRDNIGRWVAKCREEGKRGTVVALLPADISTSWFHEYVMKGAVEIRFLRRRVRFIDPDTMRPWGSPTFGSMVVVWVPWYGGGCPHVKSWDWRPREVV